MVVVGKALKSAPLVAVPPVWAMSTLTDPFRLLGVVTRVTMIGGDALLGGRAGRGLELNGADGRGHPGFEGVEANPGRGRLGLLRWATIRPGEHTLEESVQRHGRDPLVYDETDERCGCVACGGF